MTQINQVRVFEKFVSVWRFLFSFLSLLLLELSGNDLLNLLYGRLVQEVERPATHGQRPRHQDQLGGHNNNKIEKCVPTPLTNYNILRNLFWAGTTGDGLLDL